MKMVEVSKVWILNERRKKVRSKHEKIDRGRLLEH